jgi:hypothetical protein
VLQGERAGEAAEGEWAAEAGPAVQAGQGVQAEQVVLQRAGVVAEPLAVVPWPVQAEIRFFWAVWAARVE